MNPKVDEFINTAHNWQPELNALRNIVLDCQLIEEFKWSQPCYTFNKVNVLIISGFKHFCSLNFFKGSLIKDNDDLLVKAGENSQSARQLRFTSLEEIIRLEPVIKSYIYQAIEIEKAGLKVERRSITDYEIPNELEQKFEEFPELKTAFEVLSPGRKKMYLLYFSQAKQAKTRISRIENYIPRILNGYGFNDCVCGHSKRMPGCDGSHKRLKS